ncbi:MAG: hypothetical protein ACE37H_11975 [Phycisphaeraceae bacterium]
MGFTRIGEGSYVYRLFDVTWPLKTETPKADVQIHFYPQARQYDDQTPPVCSVSPVAVWCDSGDVQLSQRASIFTPIYSSPGDVVIQISLDRDVLYINKAKYPEAQSLGVKRSAYGFYLDKLLLG